MTEDQSTGNTSVTHCHRRPAFMLKLFKTRKNYRSCKILRDPDAENPTLFVCTASGKISVQLAPRNTGVFPDKFFVLSNALVCPATHPFCRTGHPVVSCRACLFILSNSFLCPVERSPISYRCPPVSCRTPLCPVERLKFVMSNVVRHLKTEQLPKPFRI